MSKSTTPTKQRAPKRPAAKKTKVSVKKTQSLQSFRLSPQTTPFMSFKPSIQTVYWLILSLSVLGLGLWVINLSLQVQALYDRIDATQDQAITMPMPAKKP